MISDRILVIFPISAKVGGLTTWKPSASAAASSLCRDADAEPVAFATDVDSSCSLQLAADNFTDCEALAESVRRIHGKVFVNVHVLKAVFKRVGATVNKIGN